MRHYLSYFIATILISAPNSAYGRNRCWIWYGQVKCSLETEGSSFRNELVYPEGTVEKRCKMHPYLAEHKWKECKPYIDSILDDEKVSPDPLNQTQPKEDYTNEPSLQDLIKKYE